MPIKDNTDEAAQAADDHWTEHGDQITEANVETAEGSSSSEAFVPTDSHTQIQMAAIIADRDGRDPVAIMAEARALQPSSAADAKPVAYPGETADLIDQIRHTCEGAAVTIMGDNPDFNGQPNSAVEVVAEWTNWQTVRFTGDNVIEALRNARDMVGGKIMGEMASLSRVQLERALAQPQPSQQAGAERWDGELAEAIEAAERYVTFGKSGGYVSREKMAAILAALKLVENKPDKD